MNGNTIYRGWEDWKKKIKSPVLQLRCLLNVSSLSSQCTLFYSEVSAVLNVYFDFSSSFSLEHGFSFAGSQGYLLLILNVLV